MGERQAVATSLRLRWRSRAFISSRTSAWLPPVVRFACGGCGKVLRFRLSVVRGPPLADAAGVFAVFVSASRLIMFVVPVALLSSRLFPRRCRPARHYGYRRAGRADERRAPRCKEGRGRARGSGLTVFFARKNPPAAHCNWPRRVPVVPIRNFRTRVE